MITGASTPQVSDRYVIQMIELRIGSVLARHLMKWSCMRTIQISIGEIIEAMYEELVETYGDKELALVAAQALGDDLLARFAKGGAVERDTP
jgi:hypothetical protein